MEDKTEAKSKTKLAHAIENAALENINEDITEIFKITEAILKDLPVLAQKQVQSLHDEITSLEKALKVVPDEFNNSFEKKINRILDVAAEIADHTKKYQQELVVDLEILLSKYVQKINYQLSKHIKDNFIIKRSSLYFIVFVTSLLGGLIGAGIIAAMFYIYI